MRVVDRIGWCVVMYMASVSMLLAQGSVLQSGTWYKVAIEKNGVYKLSYNDLRAMGFDVNTLDPRNLRIYGQEGGMLPQPNATPRPDRLVELAIQVVGESDGKLNAEDYILFYGEGADRIRYAVNQDIIQYESNLYSTRNFYFVTLGNGAGQRIASISSVAGSHPVVNQYQDYVYHELDEVNILKSGREWFGERFDLTLSYTFSFDIPNIVPNTTLTLVSDVMTQTFSTASFKVYLNNNLVVEQNPGVIPNTQYGIKGRHKRDTVTLNSSTVNAATATQQQLRYDFTKAASGRSLGFLDFFLLSYTRQLTHHSDQVIFRAAESLNQATTRYQIANPKSNAQVWDITDLYRVQQQAFTIQGTTAEFAAASTSLHTYIVFNNSIPTPTLVGGVDNQNITGIATPDHVIIAHPTLLSEARRLADHHAQHNGYNVAVVSTDDVFHEFSSGRQDVTALRDYVRFLYQKTPGKLKGLLLFGKGSYDYKDRISGNTNLVPTYESRNALSPLETYSSDDYFGFLENSEGQWGESFPVQQHSLDIGVGRLPVKTAQEAAAVVDKIISYQTGSKQPGRWRKDIVFVADDGSIADGFTSIHQAQANSLAENIEGAYPAFDTRKIFLGTYTKTVSASGETIPEANADIKRHFAAGALIINYTGHGSETLWADEKILTEDDIADLHHDHYPFLVTATCEFGRQDDPGIVSGAEEVVLQPKGGAIGLVTTARPVNSSTNFSLNQAFYNACFTREGDAYLTLGETFRRTKNNSLSGVANRNFSLLGDPMLTLALPTFEVAVTSIKTASGSDTLKALSRVIMEGEVRDASGTRAADFNGLLHATLYDKKTDFATIGRNDPAFSFQQWYNALFRGQARVQDGRFTFECILPKSMAYTIDWGKLSLYARDTQQGDASGAQAVKIGGTERGIADDRTSPDLQVYMGDTSFVSGGITASSTTLLVRVHDDSGLNISAYGIGNTMVAILDGKTVYALPEYYLADADDYTRGWITLPVSGLAPGRHTFTVHVWDTYNNAATGSVNFVVTEGSGLVIESFGNYPNPFVTETTLFFTHNRSGEDLEVGIALYSVQGELIWQDIQTISGSTYEVNISPDIRKKLSAGLYFARLVVRSLTDSSKSERVAKLIVVN